MKTTRTALSTVTALSVIAITGFAGCVAGTADDPGETQATQEELTAREPMPPEPEELAPSDDLAVTQTDSGDGWRRIHFEGMIPDADTGEVSPINEDVLVLAGSSAISKSPLPPKTKQSLLNEAKYFTASELNDVIVVDEQTALAVEAQTATPYSICSDVDTTKSTGLSLNRSISYHKSSEAGSFEGSADFDANVNASVTGTLTMHLKRAWVFGCRTYWAKFKSVEIKGNGTVTASVDANGSFKKEWHWSKQVAKPHLGDLSFSIYGIPVNFHFNAPIDVGIDASAEASLVAKGSAVANGTFDVSCTSSTCSGSKSGTASYTPDGTPSLALSGRVQVKPWVQGSVRGYLYYESVAQGQVGVRATLAGDLWAYSGNTCGDANNDGVNEYVNALTFDVQGNLAVVARAAIAGSEVYSHSWSVYSTKHHFWDLIGSSALDPIFYSSSTAGTTATVRGRMRPCYPYSDSVTYDIQWGDGSTKTTFGSAPASLWSKSHTYSLPRTRTATLTAVHDSAGRDLNHSTARSISLGKVIAPGEFYPF